MKKKGKKSTYTDIICSTKGATVQPSTTLVNTTNIKLAVAQQKAKTITYKCGTPKPVQGGATTACLKHRAKN